LSASAIRLPANNWRPRPYQLPVWSYLERGGRRAICIWHRRSGKDEIALHRAAVAAHERPAMYWHMLPEQAQARKAVWNAVNPHTGRRRIDEAFPRELRETTREDEMLIRFRNGSVWQVVGSDNYNSLVGSPPAGVVFSEWALADPAAWGYLRPILVENGGWAFFITTPRGDNHAKAMLDGARDDPNWFAEVRSARDTGAFTDEQLDAELKGYVQDFGPDHGQAMFEQEYFCSFEAAVPGAIYAGELHRATDEGRIRSVPYDRAQPVHTFWDLGHADATAIWFAQSVGFELRLIDYYANRGQPLAHYLGELQKRGYVWGEDWLPHDAKSVTLGTGKSIEDLMRAAGRRVRITPKLSVADGINAARTIFNRCWFDQLRCADGVEALRHYRYDIDASGQFRKTPLHNWASDGADAFRYFAVAMKQPRLSKPPRIQMPMFAGSWMA
jgi:phage terminase large subunit